MSSGQHPALLEDNHLVSHLLSHCTRTTKSEPSQITKRASVNSTTTTTTTLKYPRARGFRYYVGWFDESLRDTKTIKRKRRTPSGIQENSGSSRRSCSVHGVECDRNAVWRRNPLSSPPSSTKPGYITCPLLSSPPLAIVEGLWWENCGGVWPCVGCGTAF